MQRIINFILRYRNAFLYCFLALISLVMTVRSHSYHQSKFFNSSKWLSGSIYSSGADVSSYFGLREENRRLVEENEYLRKLLFNLEDDSIQPLDSSMVSYGVISAKLIKNSFASPRNYLTIDKGRKQGVKQDMGVITTQGILGIVENVSNNFATVQSVLNTKSNINAKIKDTNYFGSLIWTGEDYTIAQLIDIPRLVPLVVGDTIVTGGMSSIFPENIPIGTIKKYDLNESKSFYNIDVELFNDMANIKNVYLIENKNRKEIQELEAKTTNE
ncbi:rod shape-determining protein MreC [Flagellimonas taeanensis]|uniref:Cell shape-determining protein MreC n=1 Tax=Flagellimonas taeanensis TaxID=1005926 RepID=A0A1M6P920_9FLAO|nr:rod shape-determining protein MreC [Allomuricauda taeanensis]SFB66437.1 rod shape-determining protein MreC [Allomuricauda taeanensis]SHK04424.1 rod shape-determining protein MreC [Allomuricauda taeanensis]